MIHGTMRNEDGRRDLDNDTSLPLIPQKSLHTNSTTKCTANVIQQTNINGPHRLSDKTNVAIQFFVFGDTPYDPYSNTCIDVTNGGLHFAGLHGEYFKFACR